MRLSELVTNGGRLGEVRDQATSAPADAWVEDELLKILEGASSDPEEGSPLLALRFLLDQVRSLPVSEERLLKVNTVVRTLGRPEHLAVLVDALRRAAEASDAGEREIGRNSIESRMHAAYGWNGQTKVVFSSPQATAGTRTTTVHGLEDKLRYPPPLWMMSIHIWQPNDSAQAFPTSKTPEPDLVMEPPHSHPFDFASAVVTGEMHQSIYAEAEDGSSAEGRYAGVVLDKVDHVWPPHSRREPCQLTTLEHRVPLGPGDSYFMNGGLLHDVDVSRHASRTTPTITLFLATEAYRMPESCIAPSMADFHEANPRTGHDAQPLSPEQWTRKLTALSNYLRNQDEGLDLCPIVRHEDTYAFFHE